MSVIKTQFRESFIFWFERKYSKSPSHGTKTAVGKSFGWSQGHFSNILRREKFCGKEDKRREISNIIKIPYDEMIGIEPPGTEIADKEIGRLKCENLKLSHALDVLIQLLKTSYKGDGDVSDFTDRVLERLSKVEVDLVELKAEVRTFLNKSEYNGEEKREAWREFKEVVEPLIKDG